MMDGLCDHCGMESFKMISCPLCGSRVCPSCFNSERRACDACARGRQF